MDIGILVPATIETQDITGIAQRAEGLGFESLWIPEHPVIPVGFKTEVPGGGTLPEHYNRWADPFYCADHGRGRHYPGSSWPPVFVYSRSASRSSPQK